VVNFARDPSSGVNFEASPTMFWGTLLLFPVGLIIYYIAKVARARQGYDIGLAYRELPPD
jgi:hypothetical protein